MKRITFFLVFFFLGAKVQGQIYVCNTWESCYRDANTQKFTKCYKKNTPVKFEFKLKEKVIFMHFANGRTTNFYIKKMFKYQEGVYTFVTRAPGDSYDLYILLYQNKGEIRTGYENEYKHHVTFYYFSR